MCNKMLSILYLQFSYEKVGKEEAVNRKTLSIAGCAKRLQACGIVATSIRASRMSDFGLRIILLHICFLPQLCLFTLRFQVCGIAAVKPLPQAASVRFCIKSPLLSMSCKWFKCFIFSVHHQSDWIDFTRLIEAEGKNFLNVFDCDLQVQHERVAIVPK